MRCRDMKWANGTEEMAWIGLLDVGLPQTFNLWKMQYLQSAIKQSTIGEVMTVA